MRIKNEINENCIHVLFSAALSHILDRSTRNSEKLCSNTTFTILAPILASLLPKIFRWERNRVMNYLPIVYVMNCQISEFETAATVHNEHAN